MDWKGTAEFWAFCIKAVAFVVPLGLFLVGPGVLVVGLWDHWLAAVLCFGWFFFAVTVVIAREGELDKRKRQRETPGRASRY